MNRSERLRGLIKSLLNKGVLPRKKNPSVDVIHLRTKTRTVWEGHVMGSEQPLPAVPGPAGAGLGARASVRWRCWIKPPFKMHYSVLHVLACSYLTAH